MVDTGVLIGGGICIILIVIAIIVGACTHWYGLTKQKGTPTPTPALVAAIAAVTAAPATAAPVTTASVPYTYVPFIDQQNNDLTGSPFTLATMDLCASQCTNTSGCQGIAYAPTTQQCWLKNTMSNTNTIPSTTVNLGYPTSSAIFPSAMTSGNKIVTGSALVSPSQKYALIMQADGNTVVINLTTNAVVWSTGTAGKPNLPFTLNLQDDADISLYDSTPAFIWGSLGAGKAKNTYTLTMQDDGNLAVTDPANNVIWASGSNGK